MVPLSCCSAKGEQNTVIAEVKIKGRRKVKWRRRSGAQRPKSLTNTFTCETRYVFVRIRFHSDSFILWHLSQPSVCWAIRASNPGIYKEKDAPVIRRHEKSNATYEMYPMNAFGHRQLRAAVWLDRCCRRWLLWWPFIFLFLPFFSLLFLLRIARRRARTFYYLDARARIHYLENIIMNFL